MKRSCLGVTGTAMIVVAVFLCLLAGQRLLTDRPNDDIIDRSAVASPPDPESRPEDSRPRESAANSPAPAADEDIFAGLTKHPSATLRIRSRIEGGKWELADAITPLKGQVVELGVERAAGTHVRWMEIQPDLSKMYKNANFPWEPEPYTWVGFGRIDYHREELKRFRGQWAIRPFEPIGSTAASSAMETNEIGSAEHRAKRNTFRHADIGSFWFQVEIARDGQIYRSQGIEESDHRGLSPKVFRVSIRDGEGYVGYLTSFYNVPGLFGSVTYQSNHYIGVDCADVLMAAYGQWKRKQMEKNYNVAMLVAQWPHIREFDLEDGTPEQRTEWKTDVRPGDFVAVRYPGGRQYQHVGALYRDANANDILDADDLVLHAGPRPLQCSRLKDGSFDGHVVIVRPR